MSDMILSTIDQIHDDTFIAEMMVQQSLLDCYIKAAYIMKDCQDHDIRNYDIFNESFIMEGEALDAARQAAQGKEGESKLFKILAYIPRFIGGFINSMMNSKPANDQKIQEASENEQAIVQAIQQNPEQAKQELMKAREQMIELHQQQQAGGMNPEDCDFNDKGIKFKKYNFPFGSIGTILDEMNAAIDAISAGNPNPPIGQHLAAIMKVNPAELKDKRNLKRYETAEMVPWGQASKVAKETNDTLFQIDMPRAQLLKNKVEKLQQELNKQKATGRSIAVTIIDYLAKFATLVGVIITILGILNVTCLWPVAAVKTIGQIVSGSGVFAVWALDKRKKNQEKREKLKDLKQQLADAQSELQQNGGN